MHRVTYKSDLNWASEEDDLANSDFRESGENWMPPGIKSGVPCPDMDMDVDFNGPVAVVILSQKT